MRNSRWMALWSLLLVSALSYAQGDLEKALEKELLCAGNDQSSSLVHADSGKDNRALKAAGAVIKFDDEGPYNNFVYRFAKPLTVFGMPLWSVEQYVGEGGVTLSAEVSGDAAAFARSIQAKRPTAKDGRHFFLADDVVYLKKMALPAGQKGEPAVVVIGVTDKQKAAQRFYVGCYQQMEL